VHYPEFSLLYEIQYPELSSPATSQRTDQDRTARARIRDAAIARFAADGIAATQLKGIAADVAVSPALVIHHFGSKEGLRAACDEYVVEAIRTRKREAMANDRRFDPLQAIRQLQYGPPLQRYLARTLADGSPHVASLIDELVEDAVEYTAEGVKNGLLKPADDLRARVVALTMWSLGSLMLHEHVERLLGIDILDNEAGWAAWMMPAMEILAKGAIEEPLYEQWRGAIQALASKHEA
jgi:AcrR family transcriptional regulator